MNHDFDYRDRLTYLKVDEQTKTELQQFRATLREFIDDMMDDLYDHLSTTPQTAALFTSPHVMEHARSQQRNHWQNSVFNGDFDHDYLQRSAAVGKAHQRIGLEPRWYLGGYCLLLNKITTELVARYPDKPEKIVSQLNAVNKALFLDMDLAISVYIERAEEALNQRADELARVNDQLEEFAQRASELTRSNADLEEFAYVASHDLQEPLRKIQAFGDRLEAKCESSLSDEGKDYLARMRNAAVRMQKLVGDLLTYSRVSTTSDALVSVDLGEVVHDVLNDLEIPITTCEAQVEIGEMLTINADPIQMRQLMQNLISNAIKYKRSDEAPKVRIDTKIMNGQSDNHENELCQITVQDNGIGFDQKYANRIFGIFQRLHGRSEYEGTGVGLALCRKVAMRHGGTIGASSRDGEGATFTVTLPVHHDGKEHQNHEHS